MIERGVTDREDVKSTDAEDVQEMQCGETECNETRGQWMDGYTNRRSARARWTLRVMRQDR